MKNPKTTWAGIIALIAGLVLMGLGWGGVIDADAATVLAGISGLLAVVGFLSPDRPGNTLGPVVALAGSAMLAVGGVGCTGPGVLVTPDRGVDATGSPLDTITMDDADGSWRAHASGPASSLSQSAEGLDAIKTGQITRDIAYADPSGRTISISSGSDIVAKGLEVSIDPASGTAIVKLAEFSTVTSEPTRASNERLDRLVEAWLGLSEDQRAAFEAAFPTLADIIKTAITGL